MNLYKGIIDIELDCETPGEKKILDRAFLLFIGFLNQLKKSSTKNKCEKKLKP